MLADQVIVFDANGMITAVGPAASTSPMGGVAVLNLSNATCLPGLIDMHNAPSLAIRAPAAIKDSAFQFRARLSPAPRTRASPCALVSLPCATSGASGYTDVALRDAIDAGDVQGPPHDGFRPALGNHRRPLRQQSLAIRYHYKAEGVADGPWAARAKVRETIKYGADLIKVWRFRRAC